MNEKKYVNQCLESLLEYGHLKSGSATAGIAKQVLSKGLKSLTNPQQTVIDKLLNRHCSLCGEKIPLCELTVYITDNPIICSDCRHTAREYELRLPRIN